MDKYERILQNSKSRGTSSYHIGYGKIVVSFWSFIASIITIWFSLRIALALFAMSMFLFIWATLQKRVFKKKYMNSVVEENPADLEKKSIDDTKEKNRNYYRWTKLQVTTLFLFLVLLIMCFIWSWWLLVPALLSLILNGVAYSKKMKSLGRSPLTKNLDEVV